jgi:hypothetical protein
MFILLVIILNSSGSSITSQTVTFSSESNCLQAISKVIDLERTGGVGSVKARCMKK